MADHIADIVALLKADAGVDALAGDRIIGGGLTPGENASMPRAVVVVKPAGGPGRRGTLKIRLHHVDVISYGATLKEAWDVHAAVRDVLEGLTTRYQSLVSVEMATDGFVAFDPFTQWPTCYCTYRIETAIAV